MKMKGIRALFALSLLVLVWFPRNLYAWVPLSSSISRGSCTKSPTSLLSSMSSYGSVNEGSATAVIPTQDVLFDMPVSNNGARCRIILYKKGLDGRDVKIVSPLELGGLRSQEFLLRNPQAKMPALQCAARTRAASSPK